MGHITDAKRQDSNMARARVRRGFLVEVISTVNLNMKWLTKLFQGRKESSMHKERAEDIRLEEQKSFLFCNRAVSLIPHVRGTGPQSV